jgi:hypothetical protein
VLRDLEGLTYDEIAEATVAPGCARHPDHGDTIRVGDVRGEVLAIESGATVVKGPDGRVRIPNHLLMESVVVVEGDGEAPPAAAGGAKER